MSDPDRTSEQWAVAAIGAGTVLAVIAGGASAVVGAIAGLVLAMHSTVIGCPDGTVVDAGADPNCYAYPDVAEGPSIMFASLALLALIMLVARVLVVLQRSERGGARPGVAAAEPVAPA